MTTRASHSPTCSCPPAAVQLQHIQGERAHRWGHAGRSGAHEVLSHLHGNRLTASLRSPLRDPYVHMGEPPIPFCCSLYVWEEAGPGGGRVGVSGTRGGRGSARPQPPRSRSIGNEWHAVARAWTRAWTRHGLHGHVKTRLAAPGLLATPYITVQHRRALRGPFQVTAVEHVSHVTRRKDIQHGTVLEPEWAA